MSRRLVGPEQATKMGLCQHHLLPMHGWDHIKIKVPASELRQSFRSKEKPKARGEIHRLADQMREEGAQFSRWHNSA
jgi:hypothetical protein